jgi:arginine deiminase
MNPTELLAQRHRDYRKAQDRHARALERLHAAGEHVQRLEHELTEAEDEDRQALGDALVDGTKPPAGKAEKARSALTKAKGGTGGVAVRGRAGRPGARRDARRTQERLATERRA